MGDHLRAGKLSRYVTSHPGQLSLAIPLWVSKMSTSLGWEGNHRSGVAVAMRHRHSGLPVSTFGLYGLWKGDEHPAYAVLEYGSSSPLPLPFIFTAVSFLWLYRMVLDNNCCWLSKANWSLNSRCGYIGLCLVVCWCASLTGLYMCLNIFIQLVQTMI